MKNNNTKKKIFSAIAVLAMSATAIGGAMSFAACGDKSSYKSVDTTENGYVNASVISTARGTVASQSSGTTYYAGKPKEDNSVGSGTKEDPYDIGSLLAATEESKLGEVYLKPGDTVLVIPGTYSLAATLQVKANGAYNKYIRILNAAYVEGSGYENVEKKEATLDFSSQYFASTARGVQIYSNYVYWYGIDICGAGDNGMYIAGNYNTVEYCEFYNNRDTGLQLGRAYSENTVIDQWPNYNLVKNCTSHNNYDNETYGENADGFAAKLTVGYGNVFDGCIAYRNSDDGWDLYAKVDSGNIGAVIIYNCVAFENGYLEYTQRECNKLYPTWNGDKAEEVKGEEFDKYGLNSYKTRDGDGNGFKLGGSVMEGDVVMYNCLSYGNRMHGVTDNSNPGVLTLEGITSYNNSANIDNDPSSSTFGQISPIKNNENHGNIDVSRQTYSYNNLNRILSVADDMALVSLDADAYRGSVTNSILLGSSGAKSNIISGSIDADTRNGGTTYTKQIDALKSSDVFVQLPVVKNVTGEGADAVTSYDFNLTGLNDLYTSYSTLALNPNRVHLKYRNADDSINMGDMLALKDGWDAGLDVAGKGLGSVLNLASWDAYEHFYDNDFTNADAASENASIVARTKEALTINCDAGAVYQDFDVPSKMISCNITWQSSDESLLKVNTSKEDVSTSQSRYIMIEVYRPSKQEGDKQATLTATITCGTGENAVTDTKEFVITVKAGDPLLGEVYVKTQNDEIILEGSSIIIDRFTVYAEPEVLVENGLDYNGKLLTKEQFNVKTTYLYATDSNSAAVEVKKFTPSNAGVYTIKHVVSLASDTSKTAEMSYRIFVASATATVDFSGDSSVIVNRDGYAISGAVSSATGTLYALSSDKQIEVTAENIKTLGDVISQSFKGESINMQFPNGNSAEYYIYYALGNANGDITSQIYEQKVEVVSISTPEQFMKVAGGSALGEENTSTTIYVLENDIDFTGVTYTVGTSAFTGLLNGMGHKVSNVTIDTGSNNASIFYRVTGGTIENIKFDNIVINGAQEVGIVSQARGGYFYNIAITNIRATGTQRVAALIGRAFEGDVPLYIDQISVVNPIPELNDAGTIKDETGKEFVIKTSSNRAAGIIGLIQTNQSMTNDVIIYINNCYVSSYLHCGTYCASSIVAEYQDSYGGTEYKHVLEITDCVSASVIVSGGTSSRLGGIVGYQTGKDVLNITDCISIGKFYYSSVEVLTSQKNLSGIMGNFNSAAPTLIRNCVALMEEYNTDYDVTVIESLTSANTLTIRLDNEYWTFIYADNSSSELKAPYVSLNFIVNWAKAE